MILHATNIKKTFLHPKKTVLLNDVSLSLAAGESVAITGRSGEGKTTLLHILGGLEPFDEGQILVHGKPLHPDMRGTQFGFVFQAFHLLEDLSALDNVLLPAKIARRPVSKEHGLMLLKKVGLSERANFPVKLLSGGERQRVALARALCNNPDILFADEPSGNLDPENAMAVNHLLFELVAAEKKALILVTHDTALASRCHRTLTLSNGKLIEPISSVC